MACCNNNSSCQRRVTNGFETTEAPVESLMDFKDIVGLLSMMANTGIKNFSFKDASLEKLAEQVALLAAENNYLKKLAALISPTNVELVDDVVVVAFGPSHAYTLAIPAANEAQRKSLGKQFQQLAKKLGVEEEVDPKQLNLF